MKKINVLLLIILIVLSGCKDSGSKIGQTSSSNDTGIDTEALSVKPSNMPVEDVLIDSNRFVLVMTQNPQTFSPYDKYIYARYDNIYFIGLVRETQKTEYVYILDGDSYSLWKRNDLYSPFIKQTGVNYSCEEILAMFYSDVSEGSISIASICGAWGENTGDTIQLQNKKFYPGTKIAGGTVVSDKTYDIYYFNGMYCLVDRKTCISDYILRQPPDKKINLERDSIIFISRFYTEEDVGEEYFWSNVTADNKKPDIKS